jgi:hypothetical protein
LALQVRSAPAGLKFPQGLCKPAALRQQMLQ